MPQVICCAGVLHHNRLFTVSFNLALMITVLAAASSVFFNHKSRLDVVCAQDLSNCQANNSPPGPSTACSRANAQCRVGATAGVTANAVAANILIYLIVIGMMLYSVFTILAMNSNGVNYAAQGSYTITGSSSSSSHSSPSMASASSAPATSSKPYSPPSGASDGGYSAY